MDLDLIRQIINLVEEADVSELEVVEEGLRVVVKKQYGISTVQPPSVSVPSAVAPVEAVPPSEEPSSDVHLITSPMVGTFYRAPAPDADPFVDVGDSVDEETVVCILEAMKVMNELKAGVRGQVAAILVDNGQPVEFGQPLFHIRKS